MTPKETVKKSDSRAIRVPAELEDCVSDIDLEIEGDGGDLRNRRLQRPIGNVMGTLAQFSPDFLRDGRSPQVEGER